MVEFANIIIFQKCRQVLRFRELIQTLNFSTLLFIFNAILVDTVEVHLTEQGNILPPPHNVKLLINKTIHLYV